MSNEITPDKTDSTNSPKTPDFLCILSAFTILLIVVFAVIGFLIWSISKESTPDQLIKNETEALTTVGTFFGGIGLIINAYFAAQRAQAMDKTAEGALQNAQAALKNAEVAQINAQIAEDKQITERFSKAIEQLGSDKIEVRLGAIYTLERIAKDSRKDHWTIMEVLTAFVRHNAAVEENYELQDEEPQELQYLPRIPLDIQESLTVIGRRENKEQENNFLNLSNINIIGANLSGADFSRANLSGANLFRANLSEAKLSEAKLSRAHLSEANLYRANLSEAKLSEAKLSEADLYKANFSKADLYKANFSKADLCGANFSEADLFGANFSEADLYEANLSGAKLFGDSLKGAKNLTPEQVKTATNYKDAKYDEDFRAQLDLPSEQ